MPLQKLPNLRPLLTQCLQYNLSQIRIAHLNNKSLLKQCNRCHQQQSQSPELLQHSLSLLYNSQTHSPLNLSRRQRRACQIILQLLQEPIYQEQPLSKCRPASLNQKLRAAYQLLEVVEAVALSAICQVLADKDQDSAALEVSGTAPEPSTSINSTFKTRRKSSTNLTKSQTTAIWKRKRRRKTPEVCCKS